MTNDCTVVAERPHGNYTYPLGAHRNWHPWPKSAGEATLKPGPWTRSNRGVHQDTTSLRYHRSDYEIQAAYPHSRRPNIEVKSSFSSIKHPVWPGSSPPPAPQPAPPPPSHPDTASSPSKHPPSPHPAQRTLQHPYKHSS